MNVATIGPVLLASHMLGDYIFQSQRMAALKLTNPWVRLEHVAVYTICFLWPAAAYAPTYGCAILFLTWIAVTHFVTDSRRWRTSNPWKPMPILVDQSLHAVQIAIGAMILTAPASGERVGDAMWWLVDFSGIFGS